MTIMRVTADAQMRRIMMWTGVLLVLLVAKFFWPLVVYDVPLGYDAGFYRYLFVRHAVGFPPFIVADMDIWAREHPLGLFALTSPLIRAGLPVDWLIGWIWNLFPVALSGSLAWMTGRRHGAVTGLLTLLAALLSIPLFDGFAAMYWKTFASMFWSVWAFYFLEKRSWWSIPVGILAVATHHQMGLLFGLTVATWFLLPFIPFVHSNGGGPVVSRREIVRVLLAGGLIIAIGMLWYAPVWKETIPAQLAALLANDGTKTGSFPSAAFYLRTNGILLLLGAYGFLLSALQKRWTIWQVAALWPLVFVVLRLFFYKRFFLQLDFFLLPFAAMAIKDVWHRCRFWDAQWAFGVILLVQALLMVQAIDRNGPLVDTSVIDSVQRLEERIPRDAYVIGLENETAVVLRGWLPMHHVGGPGLFEIYWALPQWEAFLLGTHEERVALLKSLNAPEIYLFVSDYFRDYYRVGGYATAFLSDPCFEQTDDVLVYRVTCLPASDQ